MTGSPSTTWPHESRAGRRRVADRPRAPLARLALCYALAIVYVSVAVSPRGFNFVALDPLEAWSAFVDMPFLRHGSDQRADWMANLLMLVPFGFLLVGALHAASRRDRLGVATALLALAVSVVFIAVVKYLQLFFPPRTVTINYVLAQTAGSAIGIIAYSTLHRRLAALRRRVDEAPRDAVTVLLGLASLVVIGFFLFPFDFAFSPEDLQDRFASLGASLFAWPGEGRSLVLRLALVVAGAAMTLPIGMFLALAMPRPSSAGVAFVGFGLMIAVTIATLFVINASPFLVAIAYRTFGIALGAWLLLRLRASHLDAVRALAARHVWLAIPTYAALLFVARELATAQWRGVDEALASFDPQRLLPFWSYYIVPKAHAMRSFFVHVALFAPIGILVWLRRDGRGGAGAAALLGALAAALVEIARALKPGLQPDITSLAIAAAASGLTCAAMPSAWRLLRAAASDIAAPAFAVPRRAEVTREPEPDSAPPRRIESATAADVAPEAPAPAATAPDPVPARSPGGLVAAMAVSLLATSLLLWALALYPGPTPALAALLAIYAFALWRWQDAWLIVLPVVLPAFDLAPWTGWMMVGESDLFVLATLAALAITVRLRWRDAFPPGIAGLAIATVVVVELIGVAVGLAYDGGPSDGSDNAYLQPANAWRIAKGLGVALLLLPFLRASLRQGRPAIARFAVGMVCGLAAVGVLACAERAVFTGPYDFSSDYRVVGPFSSMHFGGGHIGAYLAMAAPFLIVLLRRPSAPAILLAVGIGIVAAYSLAVTFARAAYAAAFGAGCLVAAGWFLAQWQSRRAAAAGAISSVVVIVIPLLLGAGLAASLGTEYMRGRVGSFAKDLATREGNWGAGLGMRDDGVMTALIGMGSGTYARVATTRAMPELVPSNSVILEDGDGRFLRIRRGGTMHFVGQKIAIDPFEPLRLQIRLRAPDGRSAVEILLCEKLLIYSRNCASNTLTPKPANAWQDIVVELKPTGLGMRSVFGLMRRPIELNLFNASVGERIDIARVSLLGGDGREVIANGDFARGLDHWYFSDDEHLVWRIKSQYLMTFFEGGLLGLGALLVLMAAGAHGALRAVLQGSRMAAALLASIASWSFSFLFDSLLEAPRLGTLFYLVCFAALWGHDPGRARAPAPRQVAPDATREARPEPSHDDDGRHRVRRRRRRSRPA